MACAAEGSGGGQQQQLIVRHTFLELFDEAPMGPARPRVVSDMTDVRLPHKVQYQPSGGLAGDARPGVKGAGPSATPILSPAVVPLMPVSEEPASYILPNGVGMPTPGFQAYNQMLWPAPMGMPTAIGMPGMTRASGLGGYMAHPTTSPPMAGFSPLAPTGTWNYSTYQGAGSAANFTVPPGPAGVAPGHLAASLLQASPASAMGPLGGNAPPMAAPVSRPRAVRKSAPPQGDPYAVLEMVGGGMSEDSSGQTTVMLRNIPNRYSQAHLVQLLDENGFRCLYDFVYLPMDFRNGVNLGYAFVNLLTHEDAMRAINTFQGFSRWFYDSNKVCEVSWAHPHQGLEEHVERYRNSPVMHQCMPDEYKPMLFQHGVRIPFPLPTKAIRAPKLRPVRERQAAEAMPGSM